MLARFLSGGGGGGGEKGGREEGSADIFPSIDLVCFSLGNVLKI